MASASPWLWTGGMELAPARRARRSKYRGERSTEVAAMTTSASRQGRLFNARIRLIILEASTEVNACFFFTRWWNDKKKEAS